MACQRSDGKRGEDAIDGGELVAVEPRLPLVGDLFGDPIRRVAGSGAVGPFDEVACGIRPLETERVGGAGER